jgi:cyclophilin family peptidyl-prolyl cis-trans isomerase
LITFEEASYLDGYNVIFGQIIGGFEVIEALEQIGTQQGVPSKTATITACGKLL